LAVYFIVDVTIDNPQSYAEYSKQVGPMVARYGGRFLVRGGTTSTIEGDWQPQRLVMLRFPDRGAIRAFMEDADYAPLKALRQRVASTDLVAVDGIA